MANKVTKFLGNVVGGIFGGEGDMRDAQHAARLFTDNFMRLAPKVEFLYHVYFDINPIAARALGAKGFSDPQKRSQIEIGMLVKSAQVPGVQINTETKNQYGKKTNIQTQVQYTPINITFHDDNINMISGMWQQYFKNYYADPNYPEVLNQTPTYNSPGNKQLSNTSRSFGYDSYNAADFFNHISIYQLSQHRFYEYRLINPIIQSWQGPNLNSSSSQPAENQMTLIYEGILYSQGQVEVGKPDGFAQLHYDTIPSPLSILGGGTASLFGNTGVLAGGLDVFGDVSALASGTGDASALGLLRTAIKAKNTIDNAKQLSKQGVKNELINITTGALTNTVNQTIRTPASDKKNNVNATLATTSSANTLTTETQNTEPELVIVPPGT